MEGVLVSAQEGRLADHRHRGQRRHGHYRFPAGAPAPGHYALRIRAVGYELDGPQSADVGAAAAAWPTQAAQERRTSRRSSPTPNGS